MKNQWQQHGNKFNIQEVTQQLPLLPQSVYVLRFDDRVGFYLECLSKKFPMPEKVYGTNTDFINRVIKTWKNTKTNLGVLMNGIKGTGKTVTCELICNTMDLPVIIIDQPFNNVDINAFLAAIQQDVILFFDEFEKIFAKEYGSPSRMLMIMDGAIKGAYRKLFLITTNELTIDTNMIQRPGRIRYIKTFGNLGPEIVHEIVNDRLHNKEFRAEVVTYISELELISVDIVCAVVDEVNIHNEVPEVFKDVFNAKKLENFHAIYELLRNAETGKMDREVLVYDKVEISHAHLNASHTGHTFYINKKPIGDIVKVLDRDLFVIQPIPSDEEYQLADKENREAVEPPKRVFRIEKRSSYNYTFTRGNRFDAAGAYL